MTQWSCETSIYHYKISNKNEEKIDVSIYFLPCYQQNRACTQKPDFGVKLAPFVSVSDQHHKLEAQLEIGIGIFGDDESVPEFVYPCSSSERETALVVAPHLESVISDFVIEAFLSNVVHSSWVVAVFIGVRSYSRQSI